VQKATTRAVLIGSSGVPQGWLWRGLCSCLRLGRQEFDRCLNGNRWRIDQGNGRLVMLPSSSVVRATSVPARAGLSRRCALGRRTGAWFVQGERGEFGLRLGGRGGVRRYEKGADLCDFGLAGVQRLHRALNRPPR
jgi:hypothetical protein